MATTCTLSRPSATCTNVLSTFNEDKWLASSGQAGHLFDGLTYLLQAAQEWKIQKEIDIKSPGYQAQVYSMDSVFLRSRALFEFFLGNGNNYCHARCLFDISRDLTAPQNFANWKNQLHIGAMHFQDRTLAAPLYEHGSTTVQKDLNLMPVDLAMGILDVWNDFETALKDDGHLATLNKAAACRIKAKEDAGNVFDGLKDRYIHYKLDPAEVSKLVKVF